MPRSSGAKLWSTLNKAAARNARRMQRAVNQNLTKPMTEAIVRNAVKQSAAVTAATQRALSGVVSPVQAPQNRGSGRWEEGAWGAPLAPRRYRIFVPAGVTASRRAPMLVLLHGCGQDAASFAAVTRAAAVAREAGWVVLLPEQTSQANAQRCWNWFRPAAQGGVEAGLLMALIDQACRGHPVAVDRVSVLGLSAGGAMALMLGLRYPERFAAVGSHSGAVPWSATNAAQAARAMRGGTGPMPRPCRRCGSGWRGAARRRCYCCMAMPTTWSTSAMPPPRRACGCTCSRRMRTRCPRCRHGASSAACAVPWMSSTGWRESPLTFA